MSLLPLLERFARDPDARNVAPEGNGGRVGARPHFASVVADRVPTVADETSAQALDELQEARRRLAEVPVDVVVTNHVMGLYELAAIHLGAEPPDLPSAALAIDAVACLVEGLGSRLGDDAATLLDALQNIRYAFVQIKSAQG